MTTAHLTAQQRAALELLENFRLGDWCRWIRELVDGDPCNPDLGIGNTSPNQVLSWLFESGLRRTSVFTEAIGRVYEGTPPSRTGQMYHLLQSMAVIKPDYCRDLLLRHLKQRRFDSTFFRNFNLKALALSVRSNYAIDSDLLFFAKRSALETDDFSYRLTCFRVLAKHDRFAGFNLFRLLLPHLQDDRNRKILGGVLRGIAWAESHKDLYNWYVSPYRERLERENPGLFPLLRITLRDWVVPWKPSLLRSFESDPYATLLSATLAAGYWPFVAGELLFIAETATSALLETPEACHQTLRTLWDATASRGRDWVQAGSYLDAFGVSFAWFGPDEDGLLTTRWRENLLHEQPGRELFQQEVSAGFSDQVVEALFRGARALFHTPPMDSDSPEITSALDLETLIMDSLEN
jgi:hypothetical protein